MNKRIEEIKRYQKKVTKFGREIQKRENEKNRKRE